VKFNNIEEKTEIIRDTLLPNWNKSIFIIIIIIIIIIIDLLDFEFDVPHNVSDKSVLLTLMDEVYFFFFSKNF
jgi:hypothetical protein